MSKPKTYDEIYEWCLSQPVDMTGNQAHAVACYFAIVPASCQYGKDVGMPEYRCAVQCQYSATTGGDPLQGAADWLMEAYTNCSTADLQRGLCIGYNRANRLFEAAMAKKIRGAA